MQLKFKLVHPNAKLPTYAHLGDAGMDVYAVEDVELQPFTPALVKTGLVADIPMGYEIQVRPRSGLALKEGITVWNSPGTVDCGYRNEIGVILLWSPPLRMPAPRICIDSSGNQQAIYQKTIVPGEDAPVPLVKQIHAGERIAQFVFAPVTRPEIVQVSEVSDSERGTGGFGSTGK